jgi:hypothetical protein
VRWGAAALGVPFIVTSGESNGRKRKGSPAVVGFRDFSYEVIKKGGEALECHLMRGMEEAPVALHFDFIPALEVDGRWRAERRLGQRKETTPKVGWAGVGHVGRVMLTGLVQNRKKKRKKARDGLGRG